MAKKTREISPDRVTTARLEADLAEARVRGEVARRQMALLRAMGKTERSYSGTRPGWGKYSSTGPEGGAEARRFRNAGSSYRSGPSQGPGRLKNPRGMASGGSADYHLDVSTLRRMRRDGQQALRDDAMARLTVRCLGVMAIGDGPTIAPATGDKSFDDKKADLFMAWSNGDRRFEGMDLEPCDARGHGNAALSMATRLRLLLKMAVCDGTILESFTPEGSLMMVEAERLVGPRGPGALGSFIPGKGGWINGIQLDGAGRYLRAGIGAWSSEGSTIRYGEKDLGYAYLNDGSAALLNNPMDPWPNQTVGEPALAAILERLDHTADYDFSVREAARISRCERYMVLRGPGVAGLGGL